MPEVRRHRLTLEAGQVCGVARMLSGLPMGCNTKRRVSVVYHQPRGAADRDARWKLLLDGLVRAGLLKDDSPAWCVLGTVETVKGSKRTVVTLEDIE